MLPRACIDQNVDTTRDTPGRHTTAAWDRGYRYTDPNGRAMADPQVEPDSVAQPPFFVLNLRSLLPYPEHPILYWSTTSASCSILHHEDAPGGMDYIPRFAAGTTVGDILAGVRVRDKNNLCLKRRNPPGGPALDPGAELGVGTPNGTVVCLDLARLPPPNER